jgi:hypothetical protein
MFSSMSKYSITAFSSYSVNNIMNGFLHMNLFAHKRKCFFRKPINFSIYLPYDMSHLLILQTIQHNSGIVNQLAIYARILFFLPQCMYNMESIIFM